jgi:hypothetical protein
MPRLVTEIWGTIRAEVLSAWADFFVFLNYLALMAFAQMAFFCLRLVHVDEDIVHAVEFMHKWATIITVGALFVVITFRALVKTGRVVMGREV